MAGALDSQVGEGSVCILVVDDEEQLRRLMGRVLARDGFAVAEASDGAEAVALAASAKPALAIVDQKLPPEGGASVVRALHAAIPALRIVVASGGDLDAALRDDLARIGGSFLRKPFAPRTLADMVRRVLAGESHPDGLR
ncbi:MAG: response regulator [Myxococcales bacterium]|nr:response regulator [Myxococcales bacterium]